MEVRHAVNPLDFSGYDTERIRKEFLIQSLFVPGEIKSVYSHVDRVIAGGVVPQGEIELQVEKAMKAEYFLERREIGIINISAGGGVIVDGVRYELENKDGLYIGRGAQKVLFFSKDDAKPAKFYFCSTPAHKTYPTAKIEIKKVEATHLGSQSEANERIIYKYIHAGGVKSCQLVMGMTILEPGSVWNTMPCHTHDRRMEVYLYCDLPEEAMVCHFMGQPQETRHIMLRNEEAVISPSWSIHSGVGTKSYTFIWGMAGENQDFSDMDGVAINELR